MKYMNTYQVNLSYTSYNISIRKGLSILTRINVDNYRSKILQTMIINSLYSYDIVNNIRKVLRNEN